MKDAIPSQRATGRRGRRVGTSGPIPGRRGAAALIAMVSVALVAAAPADDAAALADDAAALADDAATHADDAAVERIPDQLRPTLVQRPDLLETTVRVGDAEIRALCTSRRPQVMLLHGEDSSAEAWRPVLERLDGRVGACAYDRRASASGEGVPEPRGWYELLDELRRIHEALGAPSGYVLVGHSLGGLYARLYAADRPRDVAGLVLVEPVHEDMPRRARPGMPAEAWEAWMQRRRTPNADGLVVERLAERARRSRLPAIPVTVLTATRRRTGEGWDPRFLNEAARQVHASILHGATGGRHVPARGSGPAVHQDDPALVTAEIVRMVGAVEARRR